MANHSTPVRALLVLATAAILAAVPAAADEGMWTLDQIGQLDQARLRALGLELTPAQIWDSAAQTGLAQACPWLGGCSSAFVSPDGLILTNHHCAFRAAQLVSTADDNVIANGFLARDRSDERPARGYHVYVLEGFDDVTQRVLAAIPAGADDAARATAVEEAEKKLVAECEAPGDLRCRVAAMWDGLRYVLFRQLDLRDVRLVHIPAEGIGDFGGDVDNWMWPRHTGDYAVLRAYVGRDGKPADYSPDNVPYHPRRWLRISDHGLADDSFVFVLGYPGRTMRFSSSWEVVAAVEQRYPERIRLLEKLIAAREEQSKRSAAVAIKNASAIKFMNNSLKNSQGMVASLRATDLVAVKRRQEAELAAWIAADPARQARFGGVLQGLEAVQGARDATARRDAVFAMMLRASTMLDAAEALTRIAEEGTKPDLERAPDYMERNLPRERQKLERMQRSLDLPSDRACLRILLLEAAALPAGQHMAAVDNLVFDGSRDREKAVDRYLDTLYARTRLGDEGFRMSLFGKTPEQVAASHDPFIALAAALEPVRVAIEEGQRARDGALQRLRPLLVEALEEWHDGAIYPDANGTIRFSYGTVRGYSPRDAVHYSWLTTLSGVLAKNTGKEPFNSPAALLAAATGTEPGPYLDNTAKDVPVDFLATLDSTGGNSGSPVMNGSGELVGLLFDGNYESLGSDWSFDPAITRSIMVDIRYVFWVLDRVYHADALIREMGDPFRVLPPAGNDIAAMDFEEPAAKP